MVDQSSVELKNGYLIVTAKGDRNSFLEMIEGTKMVNEAARKYKVKCVLADYRFISFNVPLSEAYNLVKLYEHKNPIFSEIVICAVLRKDNMEIGNFWESICNRRGYQNKVFSEYIEAKNWLTQKIKQDSLLDK